MDIKATVGETAGKVWHILSDDGPQTLPQLKKKLNATGQIAELAVGWLAREDKIDLAQVKKSIHVSLK